MKTTIRSATKNDAHQIAYVHIVSWQATYRGLIPDNILDNLSLNQREQEWQERLQIGVRVWIIEQDQQTIGFARLCPSRDKNNDPQNVVEISAIYLLPDYWRQGLGHQLCDRLFDESIKMNFKEMTTWVLESNLPARRFYEAVGFQGTGDVGVEHFGNEVLNIVKYRKIF
jgi:L-amino acid N-acyltransferase YncA